MKKYFYIALIFSIPLISCKKDHLITNNQNATLHFSQDTVLFDTIFTSIGSITKELMVYNNNDFDIITNVSLNGSSQAHFRMNVDGEPGSEINDVLIRANDSIFIFIEVTIDPTNTNTPYIVSDSLTFNTGNKKQTVDLVAYGQDAYFHTANTYGNIINNNDKSYVFLIIIILIIYTYGQIPEWLVTQL